MAEDQHLVITDSGLGGLSVCGELERLLAERPAGRIRITYVNAWPAEVTGYNDLPDTSTRAEVFDRALAAIDAMGPDRIAIACNTLSILYERTEHRRRRLRDRDDRTAAAPSSPPPALTPVTPTGRGRSGARRVSEGEKSGESTAGDVLGIIPTGVELLRQALENDPAGSLVLLGTKTTIEADVHRRGLIEAGVDPARMAAVPCHGLAGAIETDPAGSRVAELIEACGARVGQAVGRGSRLYLALCCTHYSYVRERLGAAVERCSGRRVVVLDPNARMASELWEDLIAHAGPAPVSTPATHTRAGHQNDVSAGASVTIRVISRVSLDAKRRAIAALLQPASPLTAAALLDYTHRPDLF